VCESNAVLMCLLQKNAKRIFNSPRLSVRMFKDDENKIPKTSKVFGQQHIDTLRKLEYS